MSHVYPVVLAPCELISLGVLDQYTAIVLQIFIVIISCLRNCIKFALVLTDIGPMMPHPGYCNYHYIYCVCCHVVVFL